MEKTKIKNAVKRLGALLDSFGTGVVLVLCSVVFLGLVYYSMRYTEGLRGKSEIPLTMRDDPLWNLASLLTVWIAVHGAYHLLIRKWKVCWGEKKTFYVMLAVAVYIAASSIGWVCVCHVKPTADGGSLCYIAALMMEGRYGTMIPPGYMSYNPHQFSLLFVIHMIFKLFGVNQYQPFQYMNALCMPVLFWSGYRILKLAGARGRVILTYALLFLTYLPIFMYVPYVYGELTSITFTMVLMWQVLRYCKAGKKSSCLFGTLAILFACMMRMNSLIVLLAAGIVLVVYALREWKLLPVVWLLVMTVGVFACDGVIRSYYERLTGHEVLDGIPYISYVRMGLQDGERGPGWYDQTNYSELMFHDYDTEKTAADEIRTVRARLDELMQNKPYAIDFFRRKILSQWNSPACHAFFETGVFRGEKEDLPQIVKAVYFEKKDGLLDFMNRQQFVLYCGAAIMTCMSLFRAFRPKEPAAKLEDHLLLIAVLGGFFFSILWEAMSRYTLPYIVYMIPVAAMGIGRGMRDDGGFSK